MYETYQTYLYICGLPMILDPIWKVRIAIQILRSIIYWVSLFIFIY
jgi:hypothetical protein